MSLSTLSFTVSLTALLLTVRSPLTKLSLSSKDRAIW